MTFTEAMDAWSRDEERLTEMRELCSQHKIPIEVSQITRVTEAELIEFKRRINIYRTEVGEDRTTVTTTTGKRKDRDETDADSAPAWYVKPLQKDTLVAACEALDIQGGGRSRRHLSIALSEAIEKRSARDLTPRLGQLSRADLKEMCAAAKVTTSGNKDTLIERYTTVVCPKPNPAGLPEHLVAEID